MQLRTLELGTPSQKVLPLSEVFLDPSQITTSEMDLLSFFEFDAPVYLQGGTEYAIVLLSQSITVSLFLELEKKIYNLRRLFPINQHLDRYSSHRMLLLGNQVSGKILNSNCLEQIS